MSRTIGLEAWAPAKPRGAEVEAQSLRDAVIDAADALMSIHRRPLDELQEAFEESQACAARAAERGFLEASEIYRRLVAAGADAADLHALYEASKAHGGAAMCLRLTADCRGDVQEMAFDLIAGEIQGHG